MRLPHPVTILAIAFIATAPAILQSFTITLMNYIGIYALAALGLVLLTGCGGLTSFGQAAFVGIGAYATAWYTSVHGGSPWIGLVLALAFTGFVATVLGAATLRLGGHFLPLSTIAWGIAIFFLFGNIDALGRYSGLSGIPPISLGPLSLADTTANYFFIWAVLGAVMLLSRNLLDSREGRAIRSLRGGTAMVESLAIGSFRMRLAVFVLAGLLAGLSGWLYAHLQRYVSPAPFDIRPGIELLLMALVGGAGRSPAPWSAPPSWSCSRTSCRMCCRRSRVTARSSRWCFSAFSSSCCCSGHVAASCRCSGGSCRGASRRSLRSARSCGAARRPRAPLGLCSGSKGRAEALALSWLSAT
jgi:ABC-type branched-subunit amino acid transport system permease subunit